MTRSAIRSFACSVALAAGVLTLGCARRSEPGEWIATSEASHEQAARLASSGDAEGAASELRRAAEHPAPAGTREDDARVVRQDLFYRLATVELGRNHPQDAVRAASEGLALGRGKDVFTANLLVARGQAFEAVGDPRGASGDYHEALMINEALLDTALGGPGGTR